MKKYDVTLTAHYRKTVSVCAESPEQAKEKTKIILFDTDLINFTDDGFVCGEADITEPVSYTHLLPIRWEQEKPLKW